jgi:hypothetical protein
MAARVNVLTRRKDDTRKRGAEIPVRVGAFDPIDLPGVLPEDLSDRTLEAEHDIASG